jgi:hypothetical protein
LFEIKLIRNRTIGGFFELEVEKLFESAIEGSIINKLANYRFESFHTARSALRWFLKDRQNEIWLPTFICNEIIFNQGKTVYYPIIKDGLMPDLNFFEQNLKSGAIVIVPEYFGLITGSIVEYSKKRDDVIWIVDKAQSLNLDWLWGDLAIMSSRKLLGVPDGGFLIDVKGTQLDNLENHQSKPKITRTLKPYLLRYLEGYSKINLGAYSSFRDLEESLTVENISCSKTTLKLLKRVEYSIICKKRVENYNYLLSIISPDIRTVYGKKANTEDFIPMSLPILIERRDEVKLALAKKGVFAAVHWKHSPGMELDIDETRYVCDHIISLPCDQRYDFEDLDRVLTLLKSVM